MGILNICYSFYCKGFFYSCLRFHTSNKNFCRQLKRTDLNLNILQIVLQLIVNVTNNSYFQFCYIIPINKVYNSRLSNLPALVLGNNFLHFPSILCVVKGACLVRFKSLEACSKLMGLRLHK